MDESLGGIKVMTRLVDTLHKLGLNGEQRFDGRWVKFKGERCAVYVVEADWGNAYFAWCDDPQGRGVEFYRDPAAAIRAGLRRAAHEGSAIDHTG